MGKLETASTSFNLLSQHGELKFKLPGAAGFYPFSFQLSRLCTARENRIDFICNENTLIQFPLYINNVIDQYAILANFRILTVDMHYPEKYGS